MATQCIGYTAAKFTKQYFRISWNKWELVDSLLEYHISMYSILASGTQLNLNQWFGLER